MDSLSKQYVSQLQNVETPPKQVELQKLISKAKIVLAQQDESGGWLTNANSQPVIRSAQDQQSSDQISSKVFSNNMDMLAKCYEALTKG